MNYDPFSREPIFPGFFKFFFYGLHLRVLITATAASTEACTRDIQVACLKALLVML
jgi:hypothetical protein